MQKYQGECSNTSPPPGLARVNRRHHDHLAPSPMCLFQGRIQPAVLGGGNQARGPNLGYPQNWKLHGFNPLFFGWTQIYIRKKKLWGSFMMPLPGLSGAMIGSPLDPPVQTVGTNQTNQATSSSQNVLICVGDDTQWWIIFHSNMWISGWISHSQTTFWH